MLLSAPQCCSLPAIASILAIFTASVPTVSISTIAMPLLRSLRLFQRRRASASFAVQVVVSVMISLLFIIFTVDFLHTVVAYIFFIAAIVFNNIVLFIG